MTGSGTQADPYIISDADDLQAIENDLTAYYELGGDIDASATSDWNSGAGFLPIGQTDGFTGNFDGKGYSISDLYIDRSSTDYVALFRWTDAVSTIQRVSLTSADITGRDSVGALVGLIYDACLIDNCNSSGSVSGRYNAGGLIGYLEDRNNTVTISGSYSTCTITATYTGAGFIGTIYDGAATTVSNCYATGNVTISDTTGASGSGGGFIMELREATISQCYATGSVTAEVSSGNGKTSGGFVDYMRGGSIVDCYARGAVEATNAGGFLCEGSPTVAGTIDNAYSTGAITAYVNGTNLGGFCWDNKLITISNCFWDTETSGTATSDGGTGKTTSQMKLVPTFKDAGWDFDTIWYIREGVNNGYPSLGVSPIGELAGLYAVVEERFHYVDAYGAERYVLGEPV